MLYLYSYLQLTYKNPKFEQNCKLIKNYLKIGKYIITLNSI